ncbi:MAG: DUF1735 domain-containing protein [Prevotella sp.]|jgi:hypothetical protein|nr:DUF1735 domain-containing protein [Prevotella sp.]MCI1282331.1 DUF1735 domain-containing protein [Prevotella sp.]
MKIKNILMVCGALFFGTVALTSCSDNDEGYDIDGDANNLIYIDQTLSKTTTCTVYHTPVGEFGEVLADINAKIQYSTQDSVTVSAVVDTTLVSTYNSENNTTYASLPASALSAVQVKASGISAGAYSTNAPVEVSLPNEYCASLTAPYYVVPVRLIMGNLGGSASGRNIASSKTMAIHYIIIQTTSDLAYFDGTTTQNCSIVRTPVGVFGGISGNFNVSLHHAIEGDMKVTAVADNSLIDKYNSEKGTSYIALPASVTSAMTITPGTITSGKTAADPTISVSVPNDVAKALTEPGYILPLRLQVTYSNGTTQTVENSVAYLVVTTRESLINDDAEGLLGTACSDEVGKTWKCIGTDAFNASGFSGLFTGSSWSRKWALTTDNSTGYFIVDLGAVHKISAFNISSYVLKNFTVSVSTDGSTYTELGNTDGHSTIYDDNWNAWYVLYAGVPGRYVKVNLNFDTSSWAWSYSYYKTIRAFKLAFND